MSWLALACMIIDERENPGFANQSVTRQRLPRARAQVRQVPLVLNKLFLVHSWFNDL
jgi:hypothetical protein